MYYANCEWYVDMGEYNKPLCERKSLRPAKCSECPVYIRSIDDENAKLRELTRNMLRNMHGCNYHHSCGSCDFDECIYEVRMRKLGIEVKDD